MNPKIHNDERDLDAWLTRALQRQTSYIDDDGFTEGVMAQLPKTPARRWSDFVPVVVAALMVGLVASMVLPVPAIIGMVAQAPLNFSMIPLLQVGGAVMAAVTLGAGYWVWREA